MDIAVTELVNPLKIADDSILYAELQLGMQRNTRFGQHKERVRLWSADLTRELLL